MRHEYHTCASCKQFDFEKHKTEAAQGIGLCTMPTGTPHISPFVPHNGRPCVLYSRATDIERRRQYVLQHMKKETA